jgi:antirestriction protein ArdC
MSNDTVYQIVTDKIISHLENGVAPWRQPWRADDQGPRNLDGHRYRGINVLLLIMESMGNGYQSPYWLTFNQAKAKGGTVKKGEKSTVIIFWKKIMVREKNEATGKIEKKIIPMLRYYRVFNLEQTEGVKIPRKVLEDQLAASKPDADHDPIAEAEAIVLGYKDGPKITKRGARAFYVPSTDKITVPPMKAYDSAEEFYSTLFHEMGHSTGHEGRLDRFSGKNGAFGSHDYGREELVAEMTNAFLCAESGILTTVENSAAYLASWIRTIKEDNRAVVVAAGQAQRAADLIMNRVYEYEAKEDQDQEMATTAA